jgi:hypothetical protein
MTSQRVPGMLPNMQEFVRELVRLQLIRPLRLMLED